MATFGTTNATGVTTGGLTEIVGTKYTLSQTGTVSSISVYCPNSGNVTGAIYSDNAGVPNALLVSAGSVVAGAAQWTTINISSTVLNAGDYWICFMCDTNNMRGFNTGGTNQTAYNLSTTYGAAWPATFPTPSYQNNDYIGYATYSTTVLPSVPGNMFRRIKVGDGMSRSEGAT